MTTVDSLGRYNFLLSGGFLDIDDDTDYEDPLRALLKAATVFFQKKTNRKLVYTEIVNELITPWDEHGIYPREYPVISIDKLEIWNSGIEDYEEEDAANYSVVDEIWIPYPKKGRSSYALRSCLTVDELHQVRLSYKSGFDNRDWDSDTVDDNFPVPSDLEWATCRLAAHWWKLGRADLGMADLVSLGAGTENVSFKIYEDNIPTDVLAIIRNYIKPVGYNA